MAIGTTAAIIGSSIISAGASAIGARNNRRAINQASQAQERANAQNMQLQRDIFNRQVELYEPFREYGIRQTNALSDLLGLNNATTGIAGGGASVAGNALGGGSDPYGAYVTSNPDLNAVYDQTAAGGFGPYLPRSYDANNNNFLEREEFGRFHYDTFGRGEGRPLPQAGATGIQTGGPQPAETGNIQTDPNAAGFDRARDRFQNSLFYDVFTEGFNRDRDAIDAGLANQGLAFSSARMNAVENSRANNFMGALGMFTNTLLGSPSTAGASGAANAAANYGANAGNILTNQANNQANSAYARAQNNNALVNSFANIGGNILGSGMFSKPGAGFSLG